MLDHDRCVKWKKVLLKVHFFRFHIPMEDDNGNMEEFIMFDYSEIDAVFKDM